MERWTDPAWLAEVRAWVDELLAERGLAVVGEIEQPHVRAWATALRIPSDGGVVWFKASIPELAHEGGVLRVLAARRPDLVVELLAADPARGWLLQADAGTRLRDLADPPGWERVLPLYAELQRAVESDREALLAAGTPDRRLSVLPERVDELLADPPAVLDAEERARLAAIDVALLCDRLGELGVPETIQHDDLHDGNVFVRDGRILLFDWGDSSVAHPFFSLVVCLWGAQELEEGMPELDRLRDAYLEPWSDLAPVAELRRAWPAVWTLGALARAVAWRETAAALPVPIGDEATVNSVAGWLRMALESVSI